MISETLSRCPSLIFTNLSSSYHVLICHYLREFACELTLSLPPVREDGRSRAAVRGRDPGDPRSPRDPGDPWDPRMGSFFQFSIVKIGTLCFLPSPLCGEMGGRGLKHCKTQYFWHLDFRRGFPRVVKQIPEGS